MCTDTDKTTLFIYIIYWILKLQFLTQSLANTNYSSYKVFTSPHGIFIQKTLTVYFVPSKVHYILHAQTIHQLTPPILKMYAPIYDGGAIK